MSQVVAREKPFMIPVELVDSQAYWPISRGHSPQLDQVPGKSTG
jgi:hypothetical protein